MSTCASKSRDVNFMPDILIHKKHRIELPRNMIVYCVWKTNALVTMGLVCVIFALSCTNVSVDNGSVTPVDQSRVIANLPADFMFDVYQGENIIDGPRPKFSNLFAHGKPVVLNFWAGLCIPCRIEMPHFQRIYDERAHEFIMLGTSLVSLFNPSSYCAPPGCMLTAIAMQEDPMATIQIPESATTETSKGC